MPDKLTIKKKIPSYVFNVSDKLIEAGFESYLVGGSIRDILLHKRPNDFDIATNAKPEEVEAIFPKSITTNAKFGTVIVLSQDKEGETFDVEVTTYRSEEDYVGGRWPSKVEFASKVQDDLSRRDFTINSLALNLDKKSAQAFEVIDLFGGINDLNYKVIKAVGDPVERFTEDGLRGFRACRLASQLEFEIEQDTFAAIQKTLYVSEKVSMERVRDELLRLLLKSPKPSVGIRLLKDSGLLGIFLPELIECIGVVQPQYHVDDVFDHLLKTVDLAEDSVKVAALLHDIGKARTRTEDAEGIHFYGHDLKGAEMAKEVLARLRFPKAQIEKIYRLIRWHMFYYPSADWRLEEELRKNVASEEASQSLEAQNEKILKSARTRNFKEGWTDGAIRRLIKNVGGEEAIEDLIKLRIADAGANPKSTFHPEEIESLQKRIADVRAEEMALKISDLDINGEDMKNLEIESGPKMGEILKYLLDEVIEDPSINRKDVLISKIRSKFFPQN